MLKLLTKVLAISIALGATSAQAEFVTGDVKRIYPKNAVVYFRLKDDTCISGSQYYYFKMDDTSTDGKYAAKNWYTLLVSGAMASKPVSVKVESCATEGNVEIEYLYQEY
ncbi:hypothetical protein [Hahella ganghwensis]|uniref:hypothetical protein n=1 Tax=Hahella ganghwensis TaxID=286420 RepID=UPI0003803DD6|nr:hypothetical protein [Hahella ganghwensis]